MKMLDVKIKPGLIFHRGNQTYHVLRPANLMRTLWRATKTAPLIRQSAQEKVEITSTSIRMMIEEEIADRVARQVGTRYVFHYDTPDKRQAARERLRYLGITYIGNKIIHSPATTT